MARSQKSREGYLLVDHSSGAGLPEDVARAAGYDPHFCRGGRRYETPTLTCSHCKCSVVKSPFRAERYTCFKCGNHFICDFCADQMRKPDYDHTPYEKMRDAIMNQIARKSYEVAHQSPQQMVASTSSAKGDLNNV